MAPKPTRAQALDHIVVVLFENRSLDNVLGRLYRPGDHQTFEGVLGKDLSNPIPEWAEHGADRKVVPYGVASDMDSPNPDSGEEFFHTNTQLFKDRRGRERTVERPAAGCHSHHGRLRHRLHLHLHRGGGTPAHLR
jgi:hypothetical protein